VRVRAVLPTDEEEILAAFERLGPDQRYRRFMAVVRVANVDRLRRTLAGFPQRGLAIAATIPAADGIDIVGMASFVLDSDPATGEFAMAVTDAWGGRGLGGGLLGAIVEAARSRGLEELRGHILADNQPMLSLARRVGFAIERDPDDPGLRIARQKLQGAPAASSPVTR
jgi:acetyltransferase